VTGSPRPPRPKECRCAPTSPGWPTLLLTPAERAARGEQARAALRAWNGYDPSEAEAAYADAEFDRRLAQATSP